MTLKIRTPWLVQDELFVRFPRLGERIFYVRGNLLDERERPLTQKRLASEIGLAEGHHNVNAWENRGREPQLKQREALARLTGYHQAVFSRRGAEAIAEEMTAHRLEQLATDLGKAVRKQASMAREIRQLRDRVQQLEARPWPAEARSTGRS